VSPAAGDGGHAVALDDFRLRLATLTRPARATPAIVAVNVLVFAAMALSGAGLLRPDPAVHIRFGSNLGTLTLAGEWWRLGSAVFIHFGVLHLAFNMWALWDAGRLVERLYGTARFLLIYGFAGLAGSIASLAWNPAVNSAGASGAIFGVLGALLAFLLDRRNGVPLALVRTLRNSAFTFLGFSIAFGWIHAGIDNAAHLGGLAGGTLLGALLARPLTPAARARPDRLRPWLAAAAAALVVGLGVQWLANPSPGRAAELALRRDLAAFAAAESRAADGMRRVVAEAERQQLDEDAFAARLEREVLPLWEDLAAQTGGSYSLAPDSPLAGVPRLMAGYAAARLGSVRMLAAAASTRDQAMLERATAAAREADRLGEELRKAIEAGG
jgi:rhomboid protease GluP